MDTRWGQFHVGCGRKYHYWSKNEWLLALLLVRYFAFEREKEEDIGIIITSRCLPLSLLFGVNDNHIFRWWMTKMLCNNKSETTYYSTTILQCNDTTSISQSRVSSHPTHPTIIATMIRKKKTRTSQYGSIICSTTVVVRFFGWSRCGDDDDVIHIHYFLLTCKCPYRRRRRGLFSIEKFEEDR